LQELPPTEPIDQGDEGEWDTVGEAAGSRSPAPTVEELLAQMERQPPAAQESTEPAAATAEEVVAAEAQEEAPTEGGLVDIPVAVPMENLTPETHEAAGGALEPMEVAAGEAAATTGGEEATMLPEPALEVVVRSPEIQDAEPIRSAPMTEAATSSRGGIELLAGDLVDPATVARHLEAVRQTEQWMKVSSRNSWSSQSFGVEYPSDICCLCRTSQRDPARSPTCFKASATQCFEPRRWRTNS
jgi:hypothetical protein